jgi:hypothetical protein
MPKSGISLKASQAVLGRSNPNTTLVYAETDEAAKRQAGLGRLIFPKLSQFAIAIGSGNRSKTKPLEWRNWQTQQTQNGYYPISHYPAPKRTQSKKPVFMLASLKSHHCTGAHRAAPNYNPN